jgi:hypothetical protein
VGSRGRSSNRRSGSHFGWNLQEAYRSIGFERPEDKKLALEASHPFGAKIYDTDDTPTEKFLLGVVRHLRARDEDADDRPEVDFH